MYIFFWSSSDIFQFKFVNCMPFVVIDLNFNREKIKMKMASPIKECIFRRLYSQPTNFYHKRESCTSEITTTTLVTVNGGTSRPTNGVDRK